MLLRAAMISSATDTICGEDGSTFVPPSTEQRLKSITGTCCLELIWKSWNAYADSETSLKERLWNERKRSDSNVFILKHAMSCSWKWVLLAVSNICDFGTKMEKALIILDVGQVAVKRTKVSWSTYRAGGVLSRESIVLRLQLVSGEELITHFDKQS